MQTSDEPEGLPPDRFWVKTTDVAPDPEPEPSPDTSPELVVESSAEAPAREHDKTGRGPVGALAAGLVLALALASVFGVLWLRGAGTTPDDFTTFIDDAGPDVEKTATDIATLLMNYDSTNLEQVGRQLLELSTGDFAADYERILGQGLGDALQEVTASSRGQILAGPDIYFKSASEAIALLQLVQTTQSKEMPEGQSIKYQMKITLVDTSDEGWKAARVEILSQERTS